MAYVESVATRKRRRTRWWSCSRDSGYPPQVHANECLHVFNRLFNDAASLVQGVGLHLHEVHRAQVHVLHSPGVISLQANVPEGEQGRARLTLTYSI